MAEFIYQEFQPSSDWTRDKDTHVLLVDLPGFKKEELKVQVDNLGRVMVSGERQVNETTRSHFRKVFEVPQDSDSKQISGRFDGDLLFIIIPRKTTVTSEEANNKLPSSGEIQSRTATANQTEEVHDQGPSKKDKLEKTKKDRDPDEAQESVEKKEKKERKRRKAQEKKEAERDQRRSVDDDEEDEEEAEEKKEEKPEMMRKSHRKKEKRDGDHGMRRRSALDEAHQDEEKGSRWYQVRGREEMEVLMRDAVQKIRRNKNILVTAVLAFSFGFYLSRKFRSDGDYQ